MGLLNIHHFFASLWKGDDYQTHPFFFTFIAKVCGGRTINTQQKPQFFFLNLGSKLLLRALKGRLLQLELPFFVRVSWCIQTAKQRGSKLRILPAEREATTKRPKPQQVNSKITVIQVMVQISGDHQLARIVQKPCKSWDKLPTSTADRRISEPSTVSYSTFGKFVLLSSFHQKHGNNKNTASFSTEFKTPADGWKTSQKNPKI